MLRVPDGAGRPGRPVRRRRDRPVAELRPEAHLRRPPDRRRARPLRANTIVGAGTRAPARRPRAGRLDLAPAPEIPLDGRLRGRRPADRRQAGRPRRPSGARSRRRHARQRAARPRRRRGPAAGIAGVQRPGIVHRLDRDTSGLLMVARHDAAQASLMAQLKARRVKKTYLALVQGSVAAAVGRIEAPIGRDPKHRTRMAVVADGRPSVDRLPRPRAVRRLDAARARPRHRADPPDPGPPRGDRPPGRGRPGLRHGHVAARPGPGLERLFLHAWRLELTSPIDGHLIRADGAAARPSSKRSSTGLREVVR